MVEEKKEMAGQVLVAESIKSEFIKVGTHSIRKVMEVGEE
jgi:hypothetical protein